jgi:hypothetical protein
LGAVNYDFSIFNP